MMLALPDFNKDRERLTMSGFLFSPQITQSAVNTKIKSSKDLLENIEQSRKDEFIRRLQSRVNEFERELSNPQITRAEKTLVLEQFERFANILHRCLSHPERANASIKHYLSNRYYPVGVDDVKKPHREHATLAKTGVFLGVSLLIGAISAFIFNPIIGAIMLSAAVTLLLPSCFYLFIPESPDTSKKKEAERELLQQGALLIKPDLQFEEPEQVDLPKECVRNNYI